MHCDSNAAGRKVTATSCALLIRTPNWHASHWLQLFVNTSSILGTFANSGGMTLLHSLCLPACPPACQLARLHGTEWLPVRRILWNFLFRIFIKMCQLIPILVKIRQKIDTLLEDLMYVWGISPWLVVIFEINCCPWGPSWGWRNSGALSVDHALL